MKHYRLNKKKFREFCINSLLLIAVIALWSYIIIDLVNNFPNYVTSNFWRP